MALNVTLWLSCLLVFFTILIGFPSCSSDKGHEYLQYEVDSPLTSHSLNIYLEPLYRPRYRRSPLENFEESDTLAENTENNRSSSPKKVPPSSSVSSNESSSADSKKILDKPRPRPSAEPAIIDPVGANASIPSKEADKEPRPSVAAVPPTKVPTSTTVAPNKTEYSGDRWVFPEEVNNKTLAQHNITKTEEDHHQYYNSSFIVDPEIGHSYWVNLTQKDGVRVNEMLSKSYRRAATVQLLFDFPFYGNLVRNVTIATGGFLYTGEYVHSWLAATQYIAPLMANFDTRISNDSLIMYHDNGTAFTVQWEKVVLQEHPNEGDFTFQVTLHKSGDITFVYQNVPIIVEQIKDYHHPVKVGLSDAYIIDRTIFFVRRKTIYEYHRVDFRKEDIKNWTVIHLSALRTCLDLKDCSSCVSNNIGFECSWCESAGRCSNGLDRHRQDWLMRGCDKSFILHQNQCIAHGPDVATTASPIPGDMKDTAKDVTRSSEFSLQPRVADNNYGHDSHGTAGPEYGSQSMPISASAIVLLVLVATLITGIGLWGLYAYRNPHTFSGQFLIKYRPSQWSWSRGEARYTAATIHM
ncbi:plexin domain-containing protein 2 [Ischnura elegans]|uniref:plexin domain-containing protein 2 n=1 Tax=Ischnura elegans TaxID=197161 RepID=UPI001ED8894A|nr:plexin domain-containing protein 2 [Ischnura elegans]